MMYKQILVMSCMLGAILLVGSCSQDTGGGKELAVKTDISCDHCKECESCEGRIVGALKATPGVKRASLKLESETILVGYDPAKIDENKIRQVIAGTGFDADDVKADPAGYEALEDCCKKKI